MDANNLGSPQTAKWYFIVAWHNAANDTVNIQVDNGPLDTASWSGGTLDGNAAFVIGSHNDLTSYAHNGRIDEVGLWKRVLTSQERAQLYNSGEGLAYPFNQASPTPPPTEPGWLRSAYSYNPEHPHAVSQVERNQGEDDEYTDAYSYDANGNLTQRVEQGVTWTQSYNAENRLASVSDSTHTWSFTYDGDGVRVKQANPDGTITLFLGGGVYTVADASGTPSVTKYYTIAGQRVAMQDGNGLQYLLSDHLGSVVGVVDASGDLVTGSTQRYLPFGAERLQATSPTDFSYTGQRSLASIGLMDYNARWYDPWLGRFTQPDTIVPDWSDPQSLNRYTYVLNNPLKYIDPSGQAECGPDTECHIVLHTISGHEMARTGSLEHLKEQLGNIEKNRRLDLIKLDAEIKPVQNIDQNRDTTPTNLDNTLSEEECPTGEIAGIVLAVVTVGFDLALVGTVIKVSTLPPPGNLIGHLALIPIEIATLEVNMLVIQLMWQSKSKDCSEIKLEYLPPWGFGDIKNITDRKGLHR